MSKGVAIVSGATKGIGLGIAKRLVKDGYKVIGTYVQDYCDEVISSIEFEGFSLVQVDVSDMDACVAFSKVIIEDYGGVDVLVNNAGIVRDKLVMMMSPEDFNTVIDVNLGGTFNMVKVFSKSMLRKRVGCIVNITSVIGEIGNVGQANYAASKAGVIGFSKSIAKEFATRGIRVNCVAPGFISTDMTDKLDVGVKDSILRAVALGSFGEVDDIAGAVSFLVSEDAKYITGQVLNVCGGMVI